MKKIFVATCCICFLLAGKNATAQNDIAPAIKPATVENAKAAQAKQQPLVPVGPVVQNSAAAPVQPAAPVPASDNTGNVKPIELKPEIQSAMQPKNIDRPKASTIEPAKKAEPVAKPTPVVATPIEGN